MEKYLARSVRKVARIFAQEFVAELGQRDQWTSKIPRETTNTDRVKLDVVDALAQLASGSARGQLLRYFSMNHRWVAMLGERNRRAATTTHEFIDAKMSGALFTLEQFKVLESKRDQVDELEGEVLDLGVFEGRSTRHLARIFPDKTIHGFDSFEGLPEDWSYVLKGTFGDLEGEMPNLPDNVLLYKGWFDDTLPAWAESHSNSRITLLRVDCDIYSSTRTIFETLGHLLSPGSWILFDELIGYPGWQGHEYKAFREFLVTSELEAEYVAYGLTYVLVRLS